MTPQDTEEKWVGNGEVRVGLGRDKNEVSVILRCHDVEGARYVLGHITWVPVTEGIDNAGKILRISRDAAQQLMDDLWGCEIRPSRSESEPLIAEAKHANDPENIQTLRSHLEDMRVIAFRSIGAEPPLADR